MRLRLQSTSKFIAYEVNTKKHRLIKLFNFRSIYDIKISRNWNLLNVVTFLVIIFRNSFISKEVLAIKLFHFQLLFLRYFCNFFFGFVFVRINWTKNTHISLAKMNENIFQVIEPIQITFFALNKTIITIKSDKRIKREIPTRC